MVNFIAILSILLLIWIWHLYRNREVIIDANDKPYLIRYFLFRPKSEKLKLFGKLYLHNFLQSDHDRALHNHPWNFYSFILSGGYIEIIDSSQVEPNDPAWTTWGSLEEGLKFKKIKPFSLIFRPAWWKHRVMLENNKKAWTIVWTSPKIQEWGFFPNNKFCHNTRYDIKTGLCDDE